MTELIEFGRDAKRIGRLGLAVALMFAVTPSFGQSPQAQGASQFQAGDALVQKAVFEVASIREDKPSPDGRISTRIGFTPNGRLTASGVPLHKLICMAYGVNDYQVIGGPAWLSSDRYTIEAKADSSIEEQLAKLSPTESRLVAQHMVQALFADRLKLKMHEETREFQILALVPARGGPKMHESVPGDSYPNGLKGRDGQGHAGMMRFSNGKLTAQGVPLDNLASQLTEQLHQTVQNKSGLKGIYDFTLEWTPEEDHDGRPPIVNGGPGGVPAPNPSGPSIFTAIQEQLGLKLESQKSAMPVFVIDQVERPSEN